MSRFMGISDVPDAAALPCPHRSRRIVWRRLPIEGYDLPMRSSMTETLLTVRRRCLVCDAEAEVVERNDTDQIGTPCEACHAPTERVAVVARRTRPVAANPHAAALGRLGGLKGGPARAERLTPERRREIARLAARRRWGLE